MRKCISNDAKWIHIVIIGGGGRNGTVVLAIWQCCWCSFLKRFARFLSVCWLAFVLCCYDFERAKKLTFYEFKMQCNSTQ